MDGVWTAVSTGLGLLGAVRAVLPFILLRSSVGNYCTVCLQSQSCTSFRRRWMIGHRSWAVPLLELYQRMSYSNARRLPAYCNAQILRRVQADKSFLDEV